MLGAAQQGSGSSMHFLTHSSAFTALGGKKNELANLQFHLFKGKMTCLLTKLLVAIVIIFALFSGPCLTGERRDERGWIHKAPTKIEHLVSWLWAIQCKTTLLYCSSERNQSSVVYLEEPHVYCNKATCSLYQSASSRFFSEIHPQTVRGLAP